MQMTFSVASADDARVAMTMLDSYLKRIDPPATPDLDQRSVELLRLPSRALNGLWSQNIFNIGQLVRLTHAELLHIPNMGRGSVRAIERALSDVGLQLHVIHKD